MAFDRLRLSKLIELMQRPQDRRIRLIERDAISHVSKRELGELTDARDFYTPFWSDAKKSVIESDFDLHEATSARIEATESRRRLYNVLLSNFLEIWSKIRAKFSLSDDFAAGSRITGKPIETEGGEVTFSNVLSIADKNGKQIAIYPYFSKDIALGQRHAGLAISAMLQSLPKAANCNVCIADMLRGQIFFDEDYEFDGREFTELVDRHGAILSEWRTQVRYHARR